MKKILIIKQDLKERERLREILDLAGYDVYTSSNALQGIREAQQILPDLVLCDTTFSRPPDGKDVLTSMRNSKHSPYVPFVFLGSGKSVKEIE